MRIVIDLQGAQTQSRFRGIGRYSMAFAKALARVRGAHEIIIALNDLIPDTIEPIRHEFKGLLPEENIRVWSALGPVCASQDGNSARDTAAQLIREAFLADMRPDFIHICSLFEGYVDDAVASIGLLDRQTPVSVTLHDLIPLVHQHIYLNSSEAHKRHYLGKLKFLAEASLIFAVSQHSLEEAVHHLQIPRHRLKVIYEAADERFRPLNLRKDEAQLFLNQHRITKPFVLYSGGYDKRKNIRRLIEAYSLLPQSLRENFQLVFTGKMSQEHFRELGAAVKTFGLDSTEVVFLGHVSDMDLVKLYNLCSLFVLPSWHEGFGLPVLEAMACGAVVIASDRSSLPEVVGRNDALFDPSSVQSIKAALERALTDETFRDDMRRYGPERAKNFSWNEAARSALAAWEDFIHQSRCSSPAILRRKRPTLAYLSPLPPERSGISDYSGELLPALLNHYAVEVILSPTNPGLSHDWIQAHCSIRDVSYFQENAWKYDRILYHVGNSVFHQHMFDLLESIPGVVVLHDFFLSGVHAYVEVHDIKPHNWTRRLYQSHGYGAVAEKFHAQDRMPVIWKYPCNLPVLQQSLGVIVHSEFSRHLARTWYGDQTAVDWVVIPHVRAPAEARPREASRHMLGISPEDFLVCSFGLLDPLKQNHRILEAWLHSKLSANPRCRLVFVGENHGGAYGQQLLKTIHESNVADRVHITGWVDRVTFHRYLAAADAAVQLRSSSRGETSGTVLDCMNYGIPTVVNAHGSMAELPQEAVWMLPDHFETRELTRALEELFDTEALRKHLGQKARDHIRAHHSPPACAQAYAAAIERFSAHAQRTLPGLVRALARSPWLDDGHLPKRDLAKALARSFPPKPRQKTLFVDVSAIVQHDLRTGIQRVTRAVLRELFEHTPAGWRIEPVYATMDQEGYRAARTFSAQFLGIPFDWARDEPVDAYEGDVFFGLDFHHSIPVVQEKHLLTWRKHGVRVFFLVYDLLPVLMPQHFPPGNSEIHKRWLQTVAKMDGAVCISKSVAQDVRAWLRSGEAGPLPQPFSLWAWHLGADVENTQPTLGTPAQGAAVLDRFQDRPVFLMVGTIEPRKGHLQTLQAFESLWAEGIDAVLVVVGQEGWKDLPPPERRTIPQIVERLNNHPQCGKRLFWLHRVSDEFLAVLYQKATCLLMASEAEGFGLPLVEAARYGLPIIARDIGVFREVAGEHAFYFPDDRRPEPLAHALRTWFDLYRKGRHPRSKSLKWRTWEQSVHELVQILLTRSNEPDVSWTIPTGDPDQKANRLRVG
uniref:Glycosyltransferase n=1 Tax=Desulfacinum infernum TaxID=35837 RepID=A0A832A530_9BACT